MIVIRKKFLLNCLALVAVCYISYSLLMNNYNDEQVVALPVNEKVIIIDARTWRGR